MARYGLLIWILWFASEAFAQEGKVDYELDLEEVPVLAKRPLKHIGIQKTRLDTVVLHESPALSMADVLLQHSTLFVKSYGRATLATAEFRGTSASHTQVTWNGMKINSPMLGTVDFSMIPSYFIDDVSLYHGASSIALTGGGLGGAVELCTKPQDVRGFGLKYVQGIGSFSTYDQFLHLNYGGECWQGATRVVYSTSKNNYRYTNYDKKTDVYEDGVWVDSYHPVERNKSGYFDDFHVLQELYCRTSGGHRFGVAFWQTVSKRGLPFLSVDYKEDTEFTNEQKNNTARAVLSWDYLRERFKWAMRAGYIYSDLAYDYFTKRQETVLSDITHSRSYANTFYGQLEAEYMPSSRWMLSAQASVYRNGVKSSDNSPYHAGDNYDEGRWEFSACLSARWKPTERFAVAACLREEVYGGKGVPPIPALFWDVVLSKRWNIVAKGSIARNYRCPSLDDLYFRPGGNPDLKPEHGFTYDGGIEWRKTGKRYSVQGNATAFDSYIDDWILWVPNTKGFWQPSNVKRVHNYGVELSAGAEYRFPKGVVLHADGNFSWTPSLNYGEQANSNDASYGKQLCYIPLYSAALTPRVAWRNWTLLYKWCYYSERFTTTSNEVSHITGRLKPYYMSDLSLEKRMAFRWLDLSVKGVVNNLLGSEYVTVLSRPMPGRNYEVFLEIRPRWSHKQ